MSLAFKSLKRRPSRRIIRIRMGLLYGIGMSIVFTVAVSLVMIIGGLQLMYGGQRYGEQRYEDMMYTGQMNTGQMNTGQMNTDHVKYTGQVNTETDTSNVDIPNAHMDEPSYSSASPTHNIHEDERSNTNLILPVSDQMDSGGIINTILSLFSSSTATKSMQQAELKPGIDRPESTQPDIQSMRVQPFKSTVNRVKCEEIRTFIHSKAPYFTEKVKKLADFFSEIKIQENPHANKTLEFFNTSLGWGTENITVKNIKNFCSFKVSDCKNTVILKMASPANKFETELTLVGQHLENIVIANEIYETNGQTWYTTEYLKLDILDNEVLKGKNNRTASMMIRDVALGIRELYNLKILPTGLSSENVRGNPFNINGHKYIKFKLTDITGIKYDGMEDRLEGDAKQNLKQMGLLFIDLNNRIRINDMGINGQMYGKKQKYEIISDDKLLCDMILVCLGQVEKPPKNIQELFNHPFFTNERPGNDRFGERKYYISTGENSFYPPHY